MVNNALYGKFSFTQNAIMSHRGDTFLPSEEHHECIKNVLVSRMYHIVLSGTRCIFIRKKIMSIMSTYIKNLRNECTQNMAMKTSLLMVKYWSNIHTLNHDDIATAL